MEGMWYLKFKYKHSDCFSAPKLEELKLNVSHYYLGSYIKGRLVYTSAIQHLKGEEKNIKKYIRSLKKHKDLVKIEVYGDIVFIQIKHKKDLTVYRAIYDPIFIYPSPAYLNKGGFEIIEVACWDKKPIIELIRSLEQNKTTEHFEILSLIEKKIDDIYVTRLLPHLPKKQKEAIKLAFQSGYYNFPRKIDLNELAKISKVSKPTFRENLRKAEAKLIPKLISE